MDLFRYGPSFGLAISLQIVTFLIALTTLDGGALGITSLCAFLEFWFVVGLLIRRNKESPTDGTLRFIQWGYLVMLLGAALAHELAWYIAH